VKHNGKPLSVTVNASDLVTGEQRLFRSIIAQAIDDARRPLFKSTFAVTELDIVQARNWLLGGDEWFKAVCGLADLEASRVQAFTRKLIDEARAVEAKRAQRIADDMPGVVRNLGPLPGTGGGRQARDSAKIEFSQNEEPQPCP